MKMWIVIKQCKEHAPYDMDDIEILGVAFTEAQARSLAESEATRLGFRPSHMVPTYSWHRHNKGSYETIWITEAEVHGGVVEQLASLDKEGES